jgi:hypothetical protein
MCDYISFVVTTSGPLQIYAAPGLSSHGNARAGWNLTDPGAEAEWTGEAHDSLTVRFEDKAIAKSIRQLLVDKYPNRTALLSTITETRGPQEAAFYKSGTRAFTLVEAGPNFEELNDLLQKLPAIPWFSPTSEVSEEILEQLVSEHLDSLSSYATDKTVFESTTLKIVTTKKEYFTALAAACDAAHLVSGLDNNPWASLVEIYALGCVPVGVVDGEFIVYVPQK